MNDAKPTFLAFRYSNGIWTFMIVSEDSISEVQEVTPAKLIEIVETLGRLNEVEEKRWWKIFH